MEVTEVKKQITEQLRGEPFRQKNGQMHTPGVDVREALLRKSEKANIARRDQGDTKDVDEKGAEAGGCTAL